MILPQTHPGDWDGLTLAATYLRPAVRTNSDVFFHLAVTLQDAGRYLFRLVQV